MALVGNIHITIRDGRVGRTWNQFAPCEMFPLTVIFLFQKAFSEHHTNIPFPPQREGMSRVRSYTKILESNHRLGEKIKLNG